MADFEQFDDMRISASEYDAPTGELVVQRFKFTLFHALLIAFSFLIFLFIVFISFARSIEVSAVALDLNLPSKRIQQASSIKVNTFIKLPLGNRLLILPGDYSVSVKAEGFQDLVQTIDVTPERHQQIELLITRLPGKLDIRLLKEIESQAVVLIDGKEAGTLPDLIEGVAAGKRVITVDAPLYRPVTKTLVVQGKGQVETLSVELLAAWAQYTFTSSPEKAEIFIDGVLVGGTPKSLKIEEGLRQLKVNADGYKPFQRSLVVIAEKDEVIPSIDLIPADGVMEISTQPGQAAIILNGEYRGNSPLTLNVPPNQEQNLKVYKAGYRLLEQNLSLEPDQVVAKGLKLKADLVSVKVNVSPSDADVYVDGVRKGQGNTILNLTTLPHKISVKKSGYVTQNDNIVPTRDQEQVVDVTLLTEEAHYWSQIPEEYTNELGHSMKLFKSPGTVQLGSSRREQGRRANEVQYTAQLNKHFYVSLHETNNKQFRNFKASHSSGNYKKKSLDLGSAPVVNVSWQQAALYCNWLSEKESLEPFYQTKKGFVSGQNPNANGYRLLTEVEWAWLARNNRNSVMTYPWGESISPPDKAISNFADKQAEGLITFRLSGYDDGYRGTAPVGRFPANHRGLFDMAGNASEWVNDWYSAKANSVGNKVDPLGPDEGEFHVIRGASWAKGHLPQLRLAYRAFGAKGVHDVGFRVARYAGLTKIK